MFIPVSAAIIITYVAPESALGPIARTLMPPWFDSVWFTGANSIVKVAIIEWLLLAESYVSGVVFFVSLVVLSGWPKLALKWPIVPVPAYIATNFGTVIRFYTRGMIVYAVAAHIPHPKIRTFRTIL
jgi:hypothetical protein